MGEERGGRVCLVQWMVCSKAGGGLWGGVLREGDDLADSTVERVGGWWWAVLDGRLTTTTTRGGSVGRSAIALTGEPR